MENVLNLSEVVFSAIVLLLAAGVSSHTCYGYGTRRWRTSMVGITCCLILTVQLYHLTVAVQRVPSYPQLNGNLYRLDCHESSKGGKRPKGAQAEHYINPCFCHGGASCYDSKTGVLSGGGGHCPTDGSAHCLVNVSGVPEQIPLYIPDYRGCSGGSPATCTKADPCMPCDRNSLDIWQSGRCRLCATDVTRSCNFLPDIGPYCLASKDSKEVVPCTDCCTDPEPIFIDGICY